MKPPKSLYIEVGVFSISQTKILLETSMDLCTCKFQLNLCLHVYNIIQNNTLLYLCMYDRPMI